YLSFPSLAYRLQPPMLPPWATTTPSAPEEGTTTSPVTAWDLFLMLTTEFSDSRPMPPNSSWELPLISIGRPAISALMPSAARSSSGSTLYLAASISQRRWSSCSLSGCSADRSRAWLQSLVVSYSSQRSSSNAGACPPTRIHGVLCLVTAVQPLW